MTDWLNNVFYMLPAILIALTFHEYAHGRVADWLGDPTPGEQGRLTLNPLPHIDWLGFIMLFLVHFGWAKPVLVNPYRFTKTNLKQGMMLVSLAGPAMNFILAFLGVILISILLPFSGGGNEYFSIMLVMLGWTIRINIILCVFNLIPVPPLDGSKILAGLLPNKYSNMIYSLERYGPLILIVLIFTGIIGKIIFPVIGFLETFLYTLVSMFF